MSQIGSFALLLALALTAYSFLAGILALAREGPGSARLGETARRAGIASFVIVFLAAAVLVTAAFQDNFSIAYIFHHSNRDLPAPYKFAVLWSGQEGSLLFWSLLLSAYGLVLRLRYKTDPRLFAHASIIIAAVQVFFLLLLNFAARPFAHEIGKECTARRVPFVGDVVRTCRMATGHSLNEVRLQFLGIRQQEILGEHGLRAVNTNNHSGVLKRPDDLFEILCAHCCKDRGKLLGHRLLGFLKKRAVGKNVRLAGDAEAVAKQQVLLAIGFGLLQGLVKREKLDGHASLPTNAG